MIAVISSGDQLGPQPPLKQAVSAGTSKTSTMMADPLKGGFLSSGLSGGCG
jgi:hypothetical protein